MTAIAANPQPNNEPLQLPRLRLTDRELQVFKMEFRLSEWDNYSIIEAVKESNELPFTDASNLISAGLGNRIIPLFASPCLQFNGGFIMSSPFKHCSKCNQVLDLTFFGKDKNAKDGLTHWCKPCKNQSGKHHYSENKETHAKKSKAYRQRTNHDKLYYDANREKILAKKKEYSEKNRDSLLVKSRNYYYENRDRLLENSKEYQQVNKSRLNLKSRRYYWATKEQRAESVRKYRKAHADEISVINSSLRAARYCSEGSHTVAEWKRVKELHGNKCLKCGRAEPEITLSKDHITPLSRGGTNNADNLQPLCRSCNAKKFTKTIDYRDRRLIRDRLRKS